MSADELFCEQCGTRISPTAVFCGSCGKPTGRGAKPPAPPPVSQAAPPPAPTAPPPAPAAPPVFTPPAGPPAGPGTSVPPPGPPPAWSSGPPPGYGAPAQPYAPPPGTPPGTAARPSFASQLPSLMQLASQADYVAIIGGVVVAVAVVLPVYASVSLISMPIWMLFTPLLLAAGPIIVGFLRRSAQVGTQFATATYLSFGALAATTYWGYLFYGLFGGGLFNGFGFGSLIGGIGALIVIAAGVALLRTNPVR